MKKPVIFIIAIAIVAVVTCGALYFTGMLKLPFLEKKPEEKQPVAYVEYIDLYMLIDDEGTVTGSVSEPPEDLIKISGLQYSDIIVGERIAPKNDGAVVYALKIVENLKKNNIPAWEVYIAEDKTAVIFAGNIRILMGHDEKTEEKLRELRDFYDEVIVLSGTLDMQELSHNNIGYSFRQDQ